MKHRDRIWHEFRPSGPAHFLDTLTGERVEFGTVHFAPVRRWRKRAVSVRPVKKVRPRRRIKRKVRTATIAMEGISRETASLFIGVPCPIELQEFDEFRIFAVESPGGEIDSAQELADKVLP